MELARHYGTAVLPTRVNHPKDKAKVEKGVQTVEYWLIAALRKRQFFSIAEINEALWERLEDLNARPMQHLDKSRFDERFGLLLDREWDLRQNRKLHRRMRMARFREKAVIEDLDISAKRGLDRKQVLYLAEGKWINEKLNMVITGPTGAGKTYLACALGNAACRNGYSVRYFQLSRLLEKLKLARADGSYPKFLDQIAKYKLLILDDWLRNHLTETQTNDILEIIEDRYNHSSTMVVTQIPVTEWHEQFANPTLADAIMDRIVHNAYRLELKGESMRKRKSSLTHSGHLEV